MTAKPSNAQTVQTLGYRIAALQKYGAALGAEIPINGTSYTVAQLIAAYQACANDRSQIASARGALQVLIVQQTKDDELKTEIDVGLKAAVIAKYGADSQQVTDFGFIKPAKKATVAVKVKALVQTKATRTARHTMGTAQKKAIMAPVTAEAAPAPASPTTATAPTKS